MAGETENAKIIMQAVDNFSKVLKDYYSAMDTVERTTKEAGKAMQGLDPGPALSKISAAGKGIADSQGKIGKAAQGAKGVYNDAQVKMADASGRFVKQAKSDQDRHQQSTNSWATVIKGIYERLGHVIVDMAIRAGREMVKFATDSIKLAAAFETGMKKIESAAGGSLAEAGLTMDDVKKKALELGQKTQFSAGEAQEAFLNLVKGGVPVAMAFGEATQATLDLAAAADVELGPAAEYIAKQFAAWSAEGVTATQIADVMSQTAQASAVNVDDLALGLYNVGGAASGMGMSFEDANRGIALVVSGFSGGAEAGTGFKSMIAALTPTSKGATKAMKELGLITKDGASVFFDAKGNYEGLADTAGELQKAFAGLSEEQKAVYAETIFGTYGMNAAMQLMKKGSEGVAEMAGNMDKLGSAQEQAKKRQEGFAYAMDQFNGTIETLKIVIGTPLIGLITMLMETAIIPLANSILGLAGNFTIAGGTMDKIKSVVLNIGSTFKNLFGVIADPGNISNTHALGFALQTFMPKDIATKVSMFVRSVVIGLGQAVTWVTTNWPQISAVIMSVLGTLVGLAERFGIPMVTGLTGLLGGAIAWVIANWPMISTTISTTLAVIGYMAETHVLPFIDSVIAFLGQAVTWVQTEWPKVETLIGAGLTAVVGFVTTYIAPFVTTLISEISKAVTWVQTQWPQVQGGIGGGLTAVAGFVALYIVPFVTQLIAKIGEAVTWVMTNWPQISALIGSGLTAVAGFVTLYIVPFVTTLISEIGKAVTWVMANWPQISALIGSGLTAVVGFVTLYVVPFVTQLIAKIGEAINWVITNWPQISTLIGTGLAAISGFVTTYVIPFVTTFIGAVMQAVSWVIANWPTISATISATFATIVGIVNAVLMPVITLLVGLFGKVVNFVIENFPLMTAVATRWGTMLAAVFNAVKPLLMIVGGIFKLTFELISAVLNTFVDVALVVFKAAMQLFVGDINGALATLAGFFTEKFLAIQTFLRTQVTIFTELGKNVISGLLNGLKAKGGEIYDYLVGLVKSSVQGVKDFLGIKSPSRLMEFYGEMTMRGFADGMLSMTEQVADAARSVVENAVADVGSAMGDMAAMATEGGTGGVLGALAALGVEGGGDGGGAVGGSGAGGSQTVNVNVDGRTVARAVVRHGAAPVAAQRRRQYSGGGSNKYK